jgi:hypothetical protein
MKKLLVLQAFSFFLILGCGEENPNTVVSSGNTVVQSASPSETASAEQSSSPSAQILPVEISSFILTSENPTTQPVLSFSIETKGDVAGYLLHERKSTDDNVSIIPSLSDPRWVSKKPGTFTLSDVTAYGSHVIYLFVKDANGNIAERKSITVSYKNSNPAWTTIGNQILTGYVIDTSIAVYNDIVYVACAQSAATGSASSKTNKYPVVQKYSGGTWSALPVPYTGKAQFTSIAVDDYGILYIAMRSEALSGKLIAFKFNGITWESLGSAEGITTDTANNVKLKIYNGIPYVACRDYGLDDKSGKAAVYYYSFISKSWVLFGGTAASEGAASDIDFVISPEGTAYLGFCDESSSRKASVRYYSFSNGWSYLGSRGFSDDIATYTQIAYSDKGPVLMYRDGTVDSKPTVQLYQNNSWSILGKGKFSDGTMSSSGGDIVIHNGTPYVFFKETIGGGGLRCSCMKFNSSSWEYVGGAGFSPNAVDYIDTFSYGEAIFVSFKDWGASAAPYVYGCSVVKFY